jgi:putative DNA primase/helicase
MQQQVIEAGVSACPDGALGLTAMRYLCPIGREAFGWVIGSLRRGVRCDALSLELGFLRYGVIVPATNRLDTIAAKIPAPGALDVDPLLFNVQNGTLELGTKKDPLEIRRRRHSRTDLITRISPLAYDPNATCNLFRSFLDQILPDKDVQDWLQRWFGYCLTADYGEHVLAAFWGEGRNGKGTLIKLFQWLFGDYAATIEFATLLDDREPPRQRCLARPGEAAGQARRVRWRAEKGGPPRRRQDQGNHRRRHNDRP